MSGQHCENYDVKREQFTSLFPSNLSVSLDFVSGNSEIRGKQNFTVPPKGPVIH